MARSLKARSNKRGFRKNKSSRNKRRSMKKRSLKMKGGKWCLTSLDYNTIKNLDELTIVEKLKEKKDCDKFREMLTDLTMAAGFDEDAIRTKVENAIIAATSQDDVVGSQVTTSKPSGRYISTQKIST